MANERTPRRSSVAAVAFLASGLTGRTGDEGSGRTAGGGTRTTGEAFTDATDCLPMAPDPGGNSDLLTGPGFEPDLAAARMLAVSRCTGDFSAGLGRGLAAGGLASATFFSEMIPAGGAGADSSAATTAVFLARAAAMISAMLGRPAVPAGFGLAGCEADGLGDWDASTETAAAAMGAASTVATASGDSTAADPAAFSARAAAKMSATESFFFSAIVFSQKNARTLVLNGVQWSFKSL